MKIIKGNIFTSKSQTLVNAVNTVGVMGAGIALEYKLRFPLMYQKYLKICRNNQFNIGNLWLYKHTESKFILNFPTKTHWKYKSKEEYLIKGLEKFTQTYVQKNIKSIAFPLLGADNGGLSQNTSLSIMESYLKNCKIPIEIYIYDQNSKDDLYQKLIYLINNETVENISRNSQINHSIISNITIYLNDNPSINSLSKLTQCKGIGANTLQKIYNYINSTNKNNIDEQLNIF